jgi:hypothetical protein
VDREEWDQVLERRNIRSWEEDLRTGRRNLRDLLEAYEARTHSSAFEPGTMEFDERVKKARLWRASLSADGWVLPKVNARFTEEKK